MAKRYAKWRAYIQKVVKCHCGKLTIAAGAAVDAQRYGKRKPWRSSSDDLECLSNLEMLNSRRKQRGRHTSSRAAHGSSRALEGGPSPSRRRWLLRIKLIIGGAITLFITLFGVIAGVVGIWGRPWPTGPTIHPTGLDLVKPLSVPFNIVNKSILFPVHIRWIGCGFLNEFTLNRGTKFTPALDLRGVDMTISPDDQIPYGCYVNLDLYQPTPFEMCFVIVYEPSWLEFWRNHRAIYKTNTFFWQNGHWTEGAKLKKAASGAYEVVDKTGCELSEFPPGFPDFLKR